MSWPIHLQFIRSAYKHLDLTSSDGLHWLTNAFRVCSSIDTCKDSYLTDTLWCFREEELVERAKALRVNAGTEPGADLGPVISKEVQLIKKKKNETPDSISQLGIEM